MYLNNLAKEIYYINQENGFYKDSDSVINIIKKHEPSLLSAVESMITGQRLALIISEASEVLESDRRNIKFNSDEYFKENLMNMGDTSFNEEFLRCVKDTKEDEIANIIIRCLDFCAANNIDIDFHIQSKLRYNSLREYKHGKNY